MVTGRSVAAAVPPAGLRASPSYVRRFRACEFDTRSTVDPGEDRAGRNPREHFFSRRAHRLAPLEPSWKSFEVALGRKVLQHVEILAFDDAPVVVLDHPLLRVLAAAQQVASRRGTDTVGGLVRCLDDPLVREHGARPTPAGDGGPVAVDP